MDNNIKLLISSARENKSEYLKLLLSQNTFHVWSWHITGGGHVVYVAWSFSIRIIVCV